MINRSNIFVYFGTFLSQCLTLLTSLIVLKYISPESYGQFNYIISFGSIIGSLSTLKFEQAISIATNLGESVKAFRLSVQTSFVISLIIFPFIWVGLNMELIELLFIFFLSIGISLFASLQQLFLFTNRHKQNAILTISVALVNIVLLIFLYKIPYGLEYSYISAYFLSSIILCIYVHNKVHRLKLYSFAKFKIDFISYSFFPTSVMPMALVTILLLYGNSILLMHLYSENEVGIFSFTVRILTLPVILISSVASGLFKAKLAKYYHAQDFPAFNKERKGMLRFLLLSMVIVFPILVTLLLNIGKFIDIGGWKIIDNYVIILALYAMSQFILTPFQSIPIILSKRKLIFISNIILFSGIALIYILALKFDFKSFLIIYSSFNLLFSITVVTYYYKMRIEC